MNKKQPKTHWEYLYPVLFMFIAFLVLSIVDKLNIWTKMITFGITFIWFLILTAKDTPQKLIVTKKASIILGLMILFDSIYFFALGMQKGITFQYPSSIIPGLLEMFGLIGGLCFFYMLNKEISKDNNIKN